MSKKLHIKTPDGFKMVFCNNGGKVITTNDSKKALPSHPLDHQDCLEYFQRKFGNDVFELIDVK